MNHPGGAPRRLRRKEETDFPRPYPLVPAPGSGSGVSVSGSITSGSGAHVRALQARAGPGGFTLRFTMDRTTALPTALVPRLDIVRIR